MGILCVFCVYDTIGNRCFEKTSFTKIDLIFIGTNQNRRKNDKSIELELLIKIKVIKGFSAKLKVCNQIKGSTRGPATDFFYRYERLNILNRTAAKVYSNKEQF